MVFAVEFNTVRLFSMILTNNIKQEKVMRAGYTGHISPAEWRWVTVVSSALVLLALVPFLGVVLSAPIQRDQQFMGALHDYPAAASNLAKIVQGMRGEWLSRYLHTPEPHNGVLIDTLYILLGQISRVTSIPTIIIFHVARVGASIFMYAAIYYLSAVIWMRVRTRRIFFVLAVFGSGLGWFFAPVSQNAGYPDLIYPYPFPFYTTLINVHLPLATGCLAILASAMVEVLRPGVNSDPGANNEGLTMFVFSLLLTFLYPQGFFPIAIAFTALLLARAIRNRKSWEQTLRWLLWFGVPAMPLIVYYITVFLYNPVVAQVWLREHHAPAPPVLMLLIGLGLPLLIALPGLYRAVRRFEPDGNQFMLMWLLAMLLLVYLSPAIQMNFALGLMLPLAYFGARAAEDFWFGFVSRPWRLRLLVALLPIIGISHFYALFLPVSALRDDRSQTALLLELDYARAFRWLLSRRPDENTVTLAAPSVGTWLPAWAGTRVVYGYLSETLEAPQKLRAVQAWYNIADEQACDALLNGEYSAHGNYRVTYVFYGPREAALAAGKQTPCLNLLIPVVQFGSVTIYRYP
jgi:hypothetical protein